MSSLAKKTPMTTVANSGAEDPAAIKVAPATSGDNLNSGMKIIKQIFIHFFFFNFYLFAIKIFWQM